AAGPIGRGGLAGRVRPVRFGRAHHAVGIPRWVDLDDVLRGIRYQRAIPHRPRAGTGAMRRPPIACLIVAAAGAARAQTMLDQEQRLIEVHSLLVDRGALNAPGAYRERDLSLGLEVIVIPGIDGTTGGKRQITASDRTPVFPRLRLALGLPAPEGFRASVGIAYIPPIQLRDVSSHFAALEGEMAYAPGPLALRLRGHPLVAATTTPGTGGTALAHLEDVDAAPARA